MKRLKEKIQRLLIGCHDRTSPCLSYLIQLHVRMVVCGPWLCFSSEMSRLMGPWGSHKVGLPHEEHRRGVHTRPFDDARR